MEARRVTPTRLQPKGWARVGPAGAHTLRRGAWYAVVRMSASNIVVLDVNRRNVDGSTPLQWAVYNGDVAEVRRLLRAGADVSLANNYGATPMSLAAEVGNTDMLRLLLEVGRVVCCLR